MWAVYTGYTTEVGHPLKKKYKRNNCALMNRKSSLAGHFFPPGNALYTLTSRVLQLLNESPFLRRHGNAIIISDESNPPKKLLSFGHATGAWLKVRDLLPGLWQVQDGQDKKNGHTRKDERGSIFWIITSAMWKIRRRNVVIRNNEMSSTTRIEETDGRNGMRIPSAPRQPTKINGEHSPTNKHPRHSQAPFGLTSFQSWWNNKSQI